MGNIKVSDMTALTSLPDDAIFYVVLPDGSYGKVTKLELLSGIAGGTTPTLQEVTDQGPQTDKSIIIRNDVLDRFLAVAKGSKDLLMFADRLSHTSNGESSTQMVFAPTLIPSEIQVRNLSGTMALLSDISAVLEGISWKQPVELNLDSGVTLSGSIPTITSLTQQGVTLVDDSRVIVSGLANQIFNGIYRVNSTLVSGTYRLYRTNDANTTAELNNAVVGVTSGTHAGKTYRQSTLNPVIGTSNIVFQDFGSAVANATDLVAGISKLYNAIGIETDGGITPNAVKNALDLKKNNASVFCQHPSLNLVDSTSYFFGVPNGFAPSTSSAISRRFFSPLNGKIVAIHAFIISATPTSAQDCVLKMNNKTTAVNNTIGNIRYDNTNTSISFTGLSIDVALNDNLEFQVDVPVLTTNGTGSVTSIQVIFEQ